MVMPAAVRDSRKASDNRPLPAFCSFIRNFFASEEVTCVRKNKEKRVFLWLFAHLFVTFSQAKKLLSLENEKKKVFLLHFARLFVTLHKQNLKTMKYSKLI